MTDAAKPKRLFLPFLDGIRGLAALLVVFHHVWQFAIAAPTSPAPGWFSVFSFLKYGGYGVPIFIVVSGFCLMLPEVERTGATSVRGGIVGFGRRRMQRLLPGYYAALFGTLLLVAFVPDMRTETGSQWDITLPVYSVGSVVSHLLAFHNLFEGWQWTINPPLWSAALELQIYVVFAISLLPLARRFGTRATALAALAVSSATIAIGWAFIHPWMFGLFACGMVGAEAIVKGRQAKSYDGAVMLGAAALVAVVSVASERILSGDSVVFLQETMVGLATLVWVVILGSRNSEQGSVASLARSALLFRWVQWTGRVSYSLYLVHFPIVGLLSITLVSTWGLGVPVSFFALGLISIPISVVVSWLFFCIFERPFMRWRESSHALAKSAASVTPR